MISAGLLSPLPSSSARDLEPATSQVPARQATRVGNRVALAYVFTRYGPVVTARDDHALFRAAERIRYGRFFNTGDEICFFIVGIAANSPLDAIPCSFLTKTVHWSAYEKTKNFALGAITYEYS